MYATVSDELTCAPYLTELFVDICTCLLMNKTERGGTSLSVPMSSTLFVPFTGYNEVVQIPSGATNIDVRQHSNSGKPEDDNYLGKTCMLKGFSALV